MVLKALIQNLLISRVEFALIYDLQGLFFVPFDKTFDFFANIFDILYIIEMISLLILSLFYI